LDSTAICHLLQGRGSKRRNPWPVWGIGRCFAPGSPATKTFAANLPASLLKRIFQLPEQIFSQMSTDLCGHPDWRCDRCSAAQRVAHYRWKNPNVLLRAIVFQISVAAGNKRKYNLSSA
jgi:hypothetical protein